MPESMQLPIMFARRGRLFAVLSGFVFLPVLFEQASAQAPRTPAEAQRKCPDGRQLTISGPINKIVSGTRSRFIETDVKHPSGCRIVVVAVKGNPPVECQVGRQIRASGKTFISEGSAPDATLLATQVTCR